MTTFVARLLATELADRDGNALAFEGPRGGFLAIENARYPFAKAVASAGCAGVRLHDLRHTCASLAIRSGANVKVVQRLLGHKTATLTLDRYGQIGNCGGHRGSTNMSIEQRQAEAASMLPLISILARM